MSWPVSDSHRQRERIKIEKKGEREREVAQVQGEFVTHGIVRSGHSVERPHSKRVFVQNIEVCVILHTMGGKTD